MKTKKINTQNFCLLFVEQRNARWKKKQDEHNKETKEILWKHKTNDRKNISEEICVTHPM